MLRKIRNRRLRQECSASTTDLFNSNLGLDQVGYRGNPGLRRQESVIRKKNIELIEKLLREFDMEETVDKYSSKSVVEYRLDPNKCSYDTTASTIRLRDRLNTLMGSDVIRLNDRKYSEELGRKLQDEYEANIRRKEHNLEKAERDRVRKLMLEGVIPMKEDEDPFTYKKTQRKYRSKTKRSSKDSSGDDHSSRESRSSKTTTQKSPLTPEMDHSPPGYERVKTQVEINQRSPEMCRQMSPSRQSSPDCNVQLKDTLNESQKDSECDEHSMQSINSQSSARKRKGRVTKDNPLIQNLMEEETVDGLYNIAARLVPPPDR